MDTRITDEEPRSNWFVGASYDGEDQTPRFLREGNWENGHDDKYLDLVRSMRPGDRIAIKAAYTQKHGLPFDNRGITVSLMALKATGTITGNLNDGKRVRVDWTKQEPPRVWYFFTYRVTITRVQAGEWRADELLAFAFEGKRQEIDRFRNSPSLRERFGDESDKQRFPWTEFYEAVAEKLLDYRDNRKPLIEGIHKIADRLPALSYLQDRFADGRTGPLEDICPFTALGTFNRRTKDENRKAIAAEIAKLLGVNMPVPKSFDGLPILNNQNSWFFSYEEERENEDIDLLWDVFAAAGRFVKSDPPESRGAFAAAYDAAMKVRGVAWRLTTGFFWAHPWDFLTLDGPAREYITKLPDLPLPTDFGKRPCDSERYLKLLDDLTARFDKESYPVHSFPEFSLEAWKYSKGGDKPDPPGPEPPVVPPEPKPYTIDHAVADLFLRREKIERLMNLLRRKKNLVLQGPPGTGKTYIAKRLAWLLAGEQSKDRIEVVQFHQSYGYEDFVRGYRPTKAGGFELRDGPFLEVCERVRQDPYRPHRPHVLMIDEINRGNLSRIFGELLMLIEADKRSTEWAVRIAYARRDEEEEERIHVPPNLYLIGTMNTADRSLALVDYALRRRFAFWTVDPALGSDRFARYLEEHGVPEQIRDRIKVRLEELNDQIGKDPQLGREFRIGHGYFCRPPKESNSDDAWNEWYANVVRYEIGPLLREYWFDDTDRAREAMNRLLSED